VLLLPWQELETLRWESDSCKDAGNRQLAGLLPGDDLRGLSLPERVYTRVTQRSYVIEQAIERRLFCLEVNNLRGSVSEMPPAKNP